MFEFDPVVSGPALVPVASIASSEIDPTTGLKALVELGSDLFLDFSVDERFNEDVPTFARRRVAVVQATSATSVSKFVAGIAEGDEWSYHDFAGTGHALVVEVCEVVQGPVDYALVGIHLYDGVQEIGCKLKKMTTTTMVRFHTRSMFIRKAWLSFWTTGLNRGFVDRIHNTIFE